MATMCTVSLSLLSSVSFGAMQISVRVGTTRLGLPALAHAMSRGVFLCFLTAITLRRAGAKVPSARDARLLFARGTLGVAAMICKYSSIARLSLTEATAVTFTAPVLTIVFANLVLGEQILLADVAAATACFVGVLLIVTSKGFVIENSINTVESVAASQTTRKQGILFGLAGAVFTAGSTVTTRALGRRVHHQWNVLASGIVSIVLCIILLGESVLDVAQMAMSSKARVQALAVTAFSAYFGATAVTWSLQLVNAGTLAVLRNIDLPLSFVLGYLVLDEKQAALGTIVGSALIACTTLALGVNKMLRSQS